MRMGNDYQSAALAVFTSGLALVASATLGAERKPAPEGCLVLENAFLRRVVSVAKGPLRTVEIVNHRAATVAVPLACPEFELRLSEGAHLPATAFTLTAADFQIVTTAGFDLPAARPGKGLLVSLTNQAHLLSVEIRYELADVDFYLRKKLNITSARPLTLERIEVEAMTLADAHQPYTVHALNSQGKWSPGLGQPLYGTNSGTFWGIEFPAANNFVRERAIHCGYLWGRQLGAGVPYHAYPAVIGAADDARHVADAFLDYIDRIRVRPLRLQVQYNTWFDYGGGVNQQNFQRSVELIHQKLVKERGNRPLRAYVIDDGWQDTGRDWSDKVWKVNGKFDAGFAPSLTAVRAADSTLGLWLSPGCNFGAQGAVSRLRASGHEALDHWMSMAGPKYMQLLEDRMVELTRQGVTYFKLDGIFGHLNTREFELHGGKYGLPEMPQLNSGGMKANDPALNAAKFDGLKMYYLTAGTERLLELFRKMAAANPDVHIVISNGAYLSPWWLMAVDSVWMINADDAAGGSSRTQELVYRDDRYHEIWREENTQFPLNAIFNHEPKKLNASEPKETFRSYLYMSLSRGTGFIELYIKPGALKDYDWDVISEGLHWANETFPTFRRSRLHGGSPRAGEVYGYTGWTATQGYISIHNPAGKPQTHRLTLDRTFGLLPGTGPFRLSSPIADSVRDLKPEYAFGDSLALELRPREVRILNFDTRPRDWSVLRALQTRTDGPAAPVPVALGKHPILGVWEYRHQGRGYSREFTADGICVLKEEDKVNWTKPFTAENNQTVVVEGGLRHTLKDANTLSIEGRYQAVRKK